MRILLDVYNNEEKAEFYNSLRELDLFEGLARRIRL